MIPLRRVCPALHASIIGVVTYDTTAYDPRSLLFVSKHRILWIYAY